MLARTSDHLHSGQPLGRRRDSRLARFESGDPPRPPLRLLSDMVHEALAAEAPLRIDSIVGQRQIMVGKRFVDRRRADLDYLHSRRGLQHLMADLWRLQNAV